MICWRAIGLLGSHVTPTRLLESCVSLPGSSRAFDHVEWLSPNEELSARPSPLVLRLQLHFLFCVLDVACVSYSMSCTWCFIAFNSPLIKIIRSSAKCRARKMDLFAYRVIRYGIALKPYYLSNKWILPMAKTNKRGKTLLILTERSCIAHGD
jgi:hypothetical protein